MPRPIPVVTVLLAAVLLAAGCGLKTPLELPKKPPAQKTG